MKVQMLPIRHADFPRCREAHRARRTQTLINDEMQIIDAKYTSRGGWGKRPGNKLSFNGEPLCQRTFADCLWLHFGAVCWSKRLQQRPHQSAECRRIAARATDHEALTHFRTFSFLWLSGYRAAAFRCTPSSIKPKSTGRLCRSTGLPRCSRPRRRLAKGRT